MSKIRGQIFYKNACCMVFTTLLILPDLIASPRTDPPCIELAQTHTRLLDIDRFPGTRERVQSLPGIWDVFFALSEFYLRFRTANSVTYNEMSGSQVPLFFEATTPMTAVAELKGLPLNRMTLPTIEPGRYDFIIPVTGSDAEEGSRILIGNQGHDWFRARAVWAAGEIVIDNNPILDNRIIEINLQSGTFQPRLSSALQVIFDLFKAGIFPDVVGIAWQGDVLFNPAFYVEADLRTGEHNFKAAERAARVIRRPILQDLSDGVSE